MERKKRSKIPYIMIVVLAILIACLLRYILPYRYQLNKTVVFSESDDPLDNPLTGYAPNAENVEECKDSQLVYIGLTWSMWEPNQGEYDIEGLEQLFNIEQWKKENKHAVLRFICDIPGEEEHMDIPEWLYEKTRDGEFYNMDYGAGYSPNYENEYFLERHGYAIEALAQYCNQDDFVAYVELGSLGHWGEWHTNTDEGLMPLPDAQTCWEYTLDYSDNFHNARLLMRRNFVMASDGNMGLYNDMIGSAEDTAEWQEWIQNGGDFETSGKSIPYVPMSDFWKTAPSGGEFTSIFSSEELLGEKLVDTLSMIKENHVSFIGPKCPEGYLKDSEAAETIRERLGYRYYISSMSTEYLFSESAIQVSLVFENTGIAPIYWDWPVTMYVYNEEKEQKYWELLDINLTELLPGEKIETTAQIPFTDEFRQGYEIGIGIVDPDEDEYLTLAMDVKKRDNIQIIYTYDGDKGGN